MYNNSVWAYLNFRPWYRIDLFVKELFKGIKWSFQRINKGYCDYDRYDIADWVASVLPKMLRDFAVKTNSFPDFNRVNDYLKDFGKEPILRNYDEDKILTAWQDIIYQVANELEDSCKVDYENFLTSSFFNDLTDNYWDYQRKSTTRKGVLEMEVINEDEYNRASKNFYEHFNEFYTKKREDFNEAMRKFSLIFRNLWD